MIGIQSHFKVVVEHFNHYIMRTPPDHIFSFYLPYDFIIYIWQAIYVLLKVGSWWIMKLLPITTPVTPVKKNESGKA